MKKLTAGIFATILGLTAMGAADAAVTSKGYVDAAINAVNTEVAKKVDTTTYDAGQKTQDDRITDLETASATHATQQQLTDGLALKQDKLKTEMFVKDGDGNVVTGFTAEDGVVTYTTAKVATSQELTDLTGRMDTAESEIDDLQAADTALDGRVTTAEGKIGALETASATHATKDELTAEAETRAEADETLQKAIEAIEGGVGEIESAGIGNDGQYALTMVKNGDTITYKWERIDRAYDAGDLGEDEGDEIYADATHKPAN